MFNRSRRLGLFGAYAADPASLTSILERVQAFHGRTIGLLKTTGQVVSGAAVDRVEPREDWFAALSGKYLTVADRSPDGSFDRSGIMVAFEGHLAGQIPGIESSTQNPALVVLAAYRRWGDECFGRLNGNFSVAILDLAVAKVLVACDPACTKPVFFAASSKYIVFASSAVDVLRASGLPVVGNARGLLRYLKSGFAVDGSSTMLDGIYAIPPAHRLEIAANKPPSLSRIAYASQEPSRKRATATQLAGDLRELLIATIGAQSLAGDAGVSLSGGIDSSGIISCLRTASGPHARIRAFCFVHEHLSPSDSWNELPWAQRAADHVRATLYPVRVSSELLPKRMTEIFGMQDFPFGSPVVIAQSEVFRVAADHGIKVMLGGQGSDALFGGGDSHVAAYAAKLIRDGQFFLAASLLRRASKYAESSLFRLLLSSIRRAIGAKTFRYRLQSHPEWVHRSWFLDRVQAVREHASADRPVDPMSSVVHEQLQAVIPNAMRIEDGNARAHGLEAASPYLVGSMLRFAGGLPPDCMISEMGETKHVVRCALRGLVPEAILDRRQRVGFAVPALSWLIELRPWVEQQIGELQTLPFYGERSDPEVWRALRNGDSYSWRYAFRIWRWIALLEWTRALGVRFN
jgi:asparagine synthase (glutamine-hydrolysing)